MILYLIQLLSHWTPWDDLDMKTSITSCLILEPWKHQSVITKMIKKIYKFRRLESVLFVWMILDVVRISVTYHHLKQDKKSKISINLEAAEGHGFYWLLWLMNTKYFVQNYVFLDWQTYVKFFLRLGVLSNTCKMKLENDCPKHHCIVHCKCLIAV